MVLKMYIDFEDEEPLEERVKEMPDKQLRRLFKASKVLEDYETTWIISKEIKRRENDKSK